MFKFLRSQAKVFYWVIAGSFVLFLILGGLTGRGCQAPGTKRYEPGVIGKVNGAKLMAQQYENASRQQIASMRKQNPDRDLNADQYARARQRAWDDLVQNALIEQAIAKLKIKVSDQDVLDVFQNNPPQELLANYRGKDGQVDMARYYADLQNPEIDWSGTENYIRNLVLPRRKLNDKITENATVSDDEVRAEYIRQTGRGVAEFMGVSFADLEVPTPSDTEISNYYDSHQDDFMGPAKVSCNYVRFDKKPSEADYADVRNFILDIRKEIITGQKSFADAAAEYSEDSSAKNGGDLGTFDRKRMVAPFTEAAFGLAMGEISEPVKTRFGYHLIEVLDQEKDPDTGEIIKVHARHILLKVTPGPATLDNVHQQAVDFAAETTGENFITKAQADSLEILTPDPFQSGRDIPGLPISVEGANWTFGTENGSVSPVFENKDCYYVLLAGNKIPEGPEELDKIRGQVMAAINNDNKAQLAKEKLNPATGEVQMGASMAETAAKYGLLHAVSDTFTVNANIPQVGYGTDFNKVVINGVVGTLIPEIKTQRGLFAATPLWINPIDEKDYAQRKDGIMAFLLNQAQGKMAQKWLDEQKANAKIEDFRYLNLGNR